MNIDKKNLYRKLKSPLVTTSLYIKENSLCKHMQLCIYSIVMPRTHEDLLAP